MQRKLLRIKLVLSAAVVLRVRGFLRLAGCYLLPLTVLACLWHEVKPAICAFHSAVVPTHSNLRRNLEEDSYVSALDPDYVQMSDGVSRLGFGFGAEEDDDDFDLRHGHR